MAKPEVKQTRLDRRREREAAKATIRQTKENKKEGRKK